MELSVNTFMTHTKGGISDPITTDLSIITDAKPLQNIGSVIGVFKRILLIM